MSKNTSNQHNLPDGFECALDLSDSSCGAKQGDWITGEADISCETCNVFLFNNLHIGEEEITDTEADADDMEDDYVDDVTVAEAELYINTTPEEARAKRAMLGLDVIKNRLRLEELPAIKNFGEFIQTNRFDIQITYLVVQESKKFFSTGIAMPERMMIVTVAYCKFINQYTIPDEVYEILSYNKAKIEGIATRFFEEYAGKEQPRIITWMKTYGRSFKYTPEVVKMAVELWDAADPIYVVAEDQVRAVVWLELTKHKMEKTKINMAALARATGFDSRVISRVAKKYKVYFE